MEYACLIFLVDDAKFAIGSDQVYRIERFDEANVEYKDELPSFYRVGDYVITLDWFKSGSVEKRKLSNYERLILYRVNGKIRGIPSTDLVKVENCNLENLSLVPGAFRNGRALKWIKAFIVEENGIIPIVNLENLQTF